MRRGDAARNAPALGAVLLVACAASGPLPAAEARHAPGVAIDPVLELPRATAEALPASGVVVLAEPVDPEPARRAVREFFEAVARESSADLEDVVEGAAHARGASKAREPLLPSLRRRFERLDYTTLDGEVFYRRSEMEACTARDPSPTRPLPVVPRGDEVVVRVPIFGQGAERLLGTEIVFLLRKAQTADANDERGADSARPSPTGERREPAKNAEPALPRYKIAELYEDFRLP